MIIRTEYKTNASGRSQIVAKGGGRQHTYNYDPRYSSDTNHGHAAGALILAKREAMGITASIAKIVAHIDAGKAGHDSNDSGTKHGFSI